MTPKSMQASWRHSKYVAVVEFVLIALIYAADWKGHILLSKIPYLLAVAWLSLRVRGIRWRNLGLAAYRNWRKTLAIGITAGVGIELIELFATQPLLARFFGQPDLSAFDRVAGNVKWLLVSLAFTWTLFAFGEELVFRGYLMNRIAELAGFKRADWVVALVVSSIAFGIAHFAQGVTGVTENFIDGMILGAFYLAFGRSLAIPIVAHGVTDTVDFLLIFLHKYPGMH